ncbi:MAG: LapA family protein [Actinobacteria bacterium]|nr:LapA family protein [Actinomycetota bacterium]
MANPVRGRRTTATSWREKARIIAIAVVVVVVVALVLSNLDDATVDWIIGDTTAPLAVVLIVVFALGVAFGWLTNRRSRKY